jgi:hypothetical protein
MSQQVLFPMHSRYSAHVTKDPTPTSPQPHDDAKDPGAKKPYEAPALVRWGTLHELTQHAGYRGASDGAKKGATRTSY